MDLSSRRGTTQPNPAAVPAPDRPVRVAAVGPLPCPAAIQADGLLAGCARMIESIEDRVYTGASRVLPAGTIGKHVRHILDHFTAALAVVGRGDGVIDYDHRERDTPIETSRAAALAQIVALRETLHAVGDAVGARPVAVHLMLAADGTLGKFQSTLAREINFASHHAEHHHAMIGAIAREHGVPVPSDFGKAPSTLEYERRHGQPGPTR